jgi:hypothetical protein
VRKLEVYVEEMVADQISGSVKIQKVQDDAIKLWNDVLVPGRSSAANH